MAGSVHLIDRRLNGGNKSATNRQRFIRRYRQQLKRAVGDMIDRRSITDIGGGGEVAHPLLVGAAEVGDAQHDAGGVGFPGSAHDDGLPSTRAITGSPAADPARRPVPRRGNS